MADQHFCRGGRGARYLNLNVAGADNELIAATPGTKIVVHGLVLTGDAGGIVAFVSDTQSGGGETEIASFRLTALTAAGELSALVLPVTEAGWFSTVAGDALDIRLTTTGNADGCIVYSFIGGATPTGA